MVSHELGNPEAKAAAYGELGQLHATLGNLEQAISCLDHQQTIARELSMYSGAARRKNFVRIILF